MSFTKNENDFQYIKSRFCQNEADNIFNNLPNFKKSKLSMQSLILKIFKKFNRKYNIMPKRYNTTVIDNIIFNEKSHIVSKFKDLLINYDFNDFLKRFYTRTESAVRLPKYFEYYNLYSKIFPNYTSIPEGKYFYINIQKKQRMIDLQENMENEKSREKKMKKPNKKEIALNVFNTSVINSILNRTNKEEMEILFDVNLDNTMEEEDTFAKKINNLINNISSYEVKEDYYIDYNYESKNDKKNNKKEIISPLMNININYINFNKFNDVKTNSVSFNDRGNKNNILFNKIFNMPVQNSRKNINNNINNQPLYNEKASFLMKINQFKQNKKTFQNSINYLINSNNSKLSFSKNTISSLGKNNKSNNTKVKFPSKNKTIVYDYKNTNKESNNNTNIKIDKGSTNLKNIFSYRTSFGYLSPNSKNVNNIDLPKKFPLSSRNKKSDIDSDNTNLYLTNHKYPNKNQEQAPKNNKSTLAKKENNLYVLMNNSRNKIVLMNNHQLMPSSSTRLLNINNPATPASSKFRLKQRKKLKHSYSLLNNKIFEKNKVWNLENNNNTILKDNFYLNNFVKDENKPNKNINKNISLLINKNNSIKTKRIYQNNSSRNLNLKQINRKINNKKDITGVYVNDFIKAFNKSKKLRNDFLSQREKDIK